VSPSDTSDYAPSGPLTPAEGEWATRLRWRGRTLKWRISGRNEDGHLVAVTDLACGKARPASTRHVTQAFTPAGIVYQTTLIEPPRRRPAAR
jgi:hypothetical protein